MVTDLFVKRPIIHILTTDLHWLNRLSWAIYYLSLYPLTRPALEGSSASVPGLMGLGSRAHGPTLAGRTDK